MWRGFFERKSHRNFPCPLYAYRQDALSRALVCRAAADLQSRKKNLEESVVHEVEASAELRKGRGPVACSRGPAGPAKRLWCSISSCGYAGKPHWPRVTRLQRQLRRAFDE